MLIHVARTHNGSSHPSAKRIANRLTNRFATCITYFLHSVKALKLKSTHNSPPLAAKKERKRIFGGHPSSGRGPRPLHSRFSEWISDCVKELLIAYGEAWNKRAIAPVFFYRTPIQYCPPFTEKHFHYLIELKH